MRSNSFGSNSSSSRATSTEPEETMHIFVKDLSGNTFSLKIPRSTSVGNLRSLLALRTGLSETELRLMHAGKHLSFLTESLSAYSITEDSTVNLALPLRGGAPKKVRCTHKDCKDAAQRIVGDCGFCTGHFCGKHRMLESHNCTGLEDCKAQDKERNKEKLESERTVAIKGI
ncbi:hypothetical protein AMS68_005751 [Peltaster fructicola]|uniref:Uncharacterized protein n=1 Tax=Peltaster fructicola TaxID=286661 RepID=A0A6H0XZS0_9PEZI|nr:hypothetical protein AMS68_005751 [Peltaster fructicola]